MDAVKMADCSTVMKSFQKHMMSSPSEEGIIGSTIPRLASIQTNTKTAVSNLQNLTNPPIPEQIRRADVSSKEAETLANNTFDVVKDYVGQAATQITDIDNWKSWLEDCIPCDLRVDFRLELINQLDDQFLAILESMINQYLKELEFVLNILNASDVYGDICPLLFALQEICIPDLQRILSLLAGILYRMSVRELNSTDLMKLLVLPIFQPLFLGLFGILNQYKALIVNPLTCVSTAITTQLGKLSSHGVVNSNLTKDLAEKSAALGLVSGQAQTQELKYALDNARQPFQTLDAGIASMQNSVGSALHQLDRLLVVGVVEVNELLEMLKTEINSFLGTSDRETTEFLLNQYNKMIIFRLISFIAALIKAFTAGFNCDFADPVRAEDTVSKFLSDFLAPNAPIVVVENAQNGKLSLFLDPQLKKDLGGNLDLPVPGVVVQVGFSSNRVKSIFDDIMSKSSKPITIESECVFNSKEVSQNQLASWIKELSESGAS